MNRPSQRGVALVITLIMLSVVTMMAVFFLSISRRERSSVAVTADFTDARLMADMASARAQAEILSRMMARSNALDYGFTVSTNYINPYGFAAGESAYTNVAYQYPNGRPLDANDARRMLANLLYDPRAPVFVNVGASNEFRFYLDLNRNGRYDTNGWQAVLLTNGLPLVDGNQVVSNFFWGDPEWIAIPETPGLPHSSSNRFIGRICYVVVPEGKTLDLNFMHNQAKHLADANLAGYYRNQGVGAWELNLAAFLRALNTNYWPENQYSYSTNPTVASSGFAFLDALRLMNWRYSNSYGNLQNANQTLGVDGGNLLREGLVDSYADGPLQLSTTNFLATDPRLKESPGRPWPGSDTIRSLFDVQELYQTNRSWAAFTNRLTQPGNSRGTYDRHTFYRLMEQMGVDSIPVSESQLNLNFNNYNPTTPYVGWTALGFFTNAADRMLKAQFGVPLNHIQVHSNTLYNSSLHRVLQLAANIYDYTTNVGDAYPYFPSVFRPVFTNEHVTNVFISGYTEVTNLTFLSDPWLDLSNPSDRARVGRGSVNVYGIPLVVGAKKGLPNFNEFSLQTAVQVTRKLQLVKRNLNDTAPATNQMFVLSISNYFGAEAWNSYTQAFPRPVEMRVTNFCSVTLRLGTNQANRLLFTNFISSAVTNLAANTWRGSEFRVPLTNLVLLLTNSAYYFNPPRFVPVTESTPYDTTPGFPIPDWRLSITNRLVYMLIDKQANRLLDFVNLTNIGSELTVQDGLLDRQNVLGEQGLTGGSFWLTNRAGGIPAGVSNQMRVSLMTNVITTADWQNYGVGIGKTPADAIDELRLFLGLRPLSNTNMTVPQSLVHQVPFTPTRKFYQTLKWQANDPLVHYLTSDLADPILTDTNNLQAVKPATRASTNSNLGVLNERYRPWGGNPNKDDPNDKYARNVGVKDPLIYRSDDWDFPTNKVVGKFPNVGWLGRVHRGTPWQTVYLKAAMEPPARWVQWAGELGTHPTNDWPLLELFTTAVHPNASRGALSVNQTNAAAWAAVLGGVVTVSNSLPNGGLSRTTIPEYVPEVIDPGSTQLLAMVEGINRTRANLTNGVFRNMGSVLATPELTVRSPYLNTNGLQASYAISDAAYERIPQQILSLLKPDQPRLVIYAFGQSLKPADRSVVLTPGPFRGMCTNYQITGEFATKTQLRIEGAPKQPRVVIESYNVLPPE